MSLRDYICQILGCTRQCNASLLECLSDREELRLDLANAHKHIEQLEKMSLRPAPPELTNTVEKDTAWVGSILMGMEAKVVRLPLGPEFRLTDKDTFLDFIAWSWVDSFEYHKFYRCGNFAVSFKADADQWGVNQVGVVLDYVSSHAYNIVVFPNGKVMLLEPQSDNIFFHGEHAPQFYNLKGAVVII